MSWACIIEADKCSDDNNGATDGKGAAILFNCGRHLPRGAQHLLLLLWVVRSSGGNYEYFFDVLAIPPGQADEAAVRGRGRRPEYGSSNCNSNSNSNSSRVTVRTDEQTVIVTGNVEKVRGYDMFCIDIILKMTW